MKRKKPSEKYDNDKVNDYPQSSPNPRVHVTTILCKNPTPLCVKPFSQIDFFILH